MLLYLNFRILGEVLIILATLPLALGGGFWLIYLLDYHLSVAVAMGFIARAGVAAETGAVMLPYLKLAGRSGWCTFARLVSATSAKPSSRVRCCGSGRSG